jgi:SAM-dependent methyltransferase
MSHDDRFAVELEESPSAWASYRSGKELSKSRRRAEQWIVPTLNSLISPGCAKRVLCLGCGNAIDVVVLREFGFTSWGTDLDTNCHPAAASSFVVADACALPFAASSFDAVMSLEVVEHIGAPPGAWKPTAHARIQRQEYAVELVRVLRPGGVIVLATPNRLFPFDEHGAGKTQIRWHLPFDDLTVSYFELRRLFADFALEMGVLPYGRYFAMEKIERLIGRRFTDFIEGLFPFFSHSIVHMSPFNPHLFVYFRKGDRLGERAGG